MGNASIRWRWAQTCALCSIISRDARSLRLPLSRPGLRLTSYKLSNYRARSVVLKSSPLTGGHAGMELHIKRVYCRVNHCLLFYKSKRTLRFLGAVSSATFISVCSIPPSYAFPDILSRSPQYFRVIGNGGGKIVIIKPFLSGLLLRILQIELVQNIV